MNISYPSSQGVKIMNTAVNVIGSVHKFKGLFYLSSEHQSAKSFLVCAFFSTDLFSLDGMA